MLEIVENTPQKLILRDQRPTAGIIALIFTVLSIGAVGLLLIQVVSGFSDRIGQFDGFLWLLGMVVFIALGAGFIVLGITASLHFLVGSTCIIDRDAEAVTLERVGFLRTHTEQHSIWGISHVEVEENVEVHAFGVFLILRSYDRIPVASFHRQDEEAMRSLVQEIRAFLRRRDRVD